MLLGTRMRHLQVPNGQQSIMKQIKGADAVSLDDLDSSAAACSNPQVPAGGELQVAERYGG